MGNEGVILIKEIGGEYQYFPKFYAAVVERTALASLEKEREHEGGLWERRRKKQEQNWQGEWKVFENIGKDEQEHEGREKEEHQKEKGDQFRQL